MNIIDFVNVSLTMPRTKRRKGSGRKQRLRRFAGGNLPLNGPRHRGRVIHREQG